MNLATLRRKWLAPLFLFEIYLSLTVVMFFFGPWPWEAKNPILLAIYLITAQLCIVGGYLLAWNKTLRLYKAENELSQYLPGGIIFLKRALLVTFILLIPTSLSRTGALLPNIFNGLTDAGASYTGNFERLEGGNAFVLIEYLRMLMSPFLIAVFPLTIVYWTQLTVRTRLLSLITIFFNLSLYISTGTNKGVADVIVTLPLLVYLGIAAGVLKLRVSKKFLIVVFVVALFAFLQFFGMGQTQRGGNVGEFGIFNSGLGLLDADKKHPVSVLLSDSQRIIFESLARYIGQGYYALSLCFNIEHSSTFGFGHSMFLARNADAVFNTTSFTFGSFPGLLERQSGWGMFTLWHSIYPWLASDFGFIGTLLVIGFFSYLLGLNWGRSLLTLDPRSIALTYLLVILFFYIPANNQIFQSGETCVAFFILLIGLVIRKRVRYQSRQPKFI